MTTKRAKARRCRIAASYLLLQLFAISVTLFVRNEMTIEGIDDIPESSMRHVSFLPDRAVVRDCYLLSREERYRTAVYIDREWRKMGFHFRSAQSIESEIELHRISYLLGIRKSQAEDADIDLEEDDRLIVRACYKALQIFGS